MKKLYGWIVLGALLGGAIGYSQILCPDGSCQITGSWQGGAIIGGWFGLLVAQAPAAPIGK